MASTVIDIAEQEIGPPPRQELRVAWLFPSLARAYYWQPLFAKFAARFSHTAVFTSIWPGFASGYENAFAVHTLPGLRFVNIRKPKLDSRRGFIWVPFSIVRKLRAFAPDVIISSGFSAWTLCALLFKLFKRTRVIVYWEGCSAQSVSKSRVKAHFRRWLAHFADGAVSNSEEGASYLHSSVGIPRPKLSCHPYQVPDISLLSSGKPTPSLTDLKHPVFLYVGSLIPRKGWQYLIEAVQLLESQGMEGFTVLFVGGGEQEEDLRRVVRAQGLERIVQQVGDVAYPDLAHYYRMADVFVSPTRADTWGVAVLEAMAFGKAILCSRYAGAREMITSGENGFIFDPFDEHQLADYMARFIREKTLAERMGISSLARIAPYTPARSADVLAGLVSQITESASHKQAVRTAITSPGVPR